MGLRDVIKQANEAARYTISGITPGTWFSPNQPLPPYQPIIDPPRQYDYNVGRNLYYTPGGEKLVGFKELRTLARRSELVRLAIETRLDQMDAIDWIIQPKDEDQDGDKDPRIKTITEFLLKPDLVHDWPQWLRIVGEEIFVTDALSIYRRPNKAGGLYALELIDGSTVFPLIDETGRTPAPPDPAYEQVLKGVPKNVYTSDELIYAVRKSQINTPYGWPVVEQIIQAAKTDIERVKYQLAYFTDGTVPDAYITAPDNMTPDKVKMFEENLNALLAGNAFGRRQMPVLLHGMEVHQLKEPPLMTEFDEWFWRKIAFAFSLPPTPMVKMNNRATAENQKESATEEGLMPFMRHIKRLLDRIIREDFDAPDLEFAWDDEEERDPLVSMQIDTGYVDKGIKSINEARNELGLPPVKGGEDPMLATPTGFVPLNSYEDQQALAQQQADTARVAAQNPKPVVGATGNSGKEPPAKEKPPVKKKLYVAPNTYATPNTTH